MKNVLLIASEAVPFIKTGGLADVAGSLPKYFDKTKFDVRVMIPKYTCIPWEYREKMVYKTHFYIDLAWRTQYVGVFELEWNGVTFYFIDNEYYFKRPGIYGYYDDGERYAYFQQAVIMMMERFNFIPNVLHCNDYHTAFIPFLLREKWGFVGAYKGIKTVLTIHNLEFQGKYNAKTLPDFFSLGYDWFDSGIVRMDNDVNWMKTGILYADRVTTVSPSYACEIQTPEFGQGLDGILRMCSHKLTGILNGIDFEKYDPKTDPIIKADYSVYHLHRKLKNKIALQKEVGLPIKPKVPLIGMVSRLTAQKGCQLLLEELDNIMQFNVQMVILGNGDPYYEHNLTEIAKRYPDKLKVILAFDVKLAQRIYAGADSFLMPSAFEPCGLSQMMSLKYGTIPIVRETGGLADSVQPYNEFEGTGTGFSFYNYNAHEMMDTIDYALHTFYDCPEAWDAMVQRAMAEKLDWDASAEQYIRLFASLL